MTETELIQVVGWLIDSTFLAAFVGAFLGFFAADCFGFFANLLSTKLKERGESK